MLLLLVFNLLKIEEITARGMCCSDRMMLVNPFSKSFYCSLLFLSVIIQPCAQCGSSREVSPSELPGAAQKAHRGLGNFFLWFVCFCLIFFCSYSCSQPKQVHPAFSQSFHFSLSLLPSVHLLILFSTCLVSCQPPAPVFSSSVGIHCPVFSCPRGMSKACVCTGVGGRRKRSCVSRWVGRGLGEASSAAGIGWGVNKHVHSALQGILQCAGRHWVDWCFSSILWRKDNESGTDKSCSPHATGWRRLDYVMGKSVFMYF